LEGCEMPEITPARCSECDQLLPETKNTENG
jgi:hypothetical protein